MNNNDLKKRELGKGVLCILSYFLGANLIALLFGYVIRSLKLNQYVNIAYLLIYVIMAIIYILLFKKDLKKDLSKFKNDYKKDLKIAFKYYLRGIFIMMVSNVIISSLLNMGKSVNEMQNIANFKDNPYIQGLVIVFLAPLIEELVFRFSFRKMTKNIVLYSSITGFLFGAVHVISSLENISGLLYLVPYCAMGIALGYAYKKTDNIFSSLVFHIIHNTLTLIIIIIGIVGGVL